MTSRITVGPSNTNGLTDQFTYSATDHELLLHGVGETEQHALIALCYQFTRLGVKLAESEAELVAMIEARKPIS